jgi:hypothetical protein
MIVEQLKTLVRPVYHAVRAAVYYPKARRILEAYSTQYQEARSVYQYSGGLGPPTVSSLSAMLVEKAEPGRPGAILSLPDYYPALVDRVHAAIKEQLSRTKNCWFFPRVQSSSLPDRLEDVPAVRNGEVIAVQLRDPCGIEGLEELCRAVLPQIEQKVYGAYLIVDKVYIYRNLPGHVPDQVSWLWHYDNHPPQVRKIMIYLTEVTEETGPFEYLRASETGKPLYMPPTPLSGYGRISLDEIGRRLAAGYESHKVTGPKGTLVFFEENVAHKANVARQGCRDAVFFQVRPATFHPGSYIDPRWTGTFQHVDFNPDPYEYQPKPKPNMLSA